LEAHVFDTTTQNLNSKIFPVFAGKLLPVLFLTIIMVLYSRKLSYNDYGQFQTVWIYTNIISVVISFGLSSVILSNSLDYFYGFLKSHLSKVLLLYTIGAFVSFSIFYCAPGYFSTSLKLLLIAFILVQNVCTLTDTLLLKNNQLKIYVWINLFYSTLFFGIHLYFFYQNFVLSQLIIFISCLSALKAACIFFVKKKQPAIVRSKAPKNFIANWMYIGVNEITGIVAKWLDKIFLLYLLSSSEFAIFFNGAFEIPLFGILISSMEYLMLINISSDISNKQSASTIFRGSFKILSLIAFPAFFFLLTIHVEAFALIFNNKYNASIPVFLISIFIIPVRITHYGVILQCYGHSKKIMFGSLMDIGFSLLLMLILYPIMGTPGVALAIVVSTYFQAGYYIWQSAKVMQVKISTLVPLNFLLKVLSTLALTYGILYFAKQYFSSITSLIVISAISLVIIGSGLIFYWKSVKTNQYSN
jgi:O-antigen/teichoic acid export membrane protein